MVGARRVEESEAGASLAPVKHRILMAVALSLAIYGAAGWIYIAANAVSHPESLHMPLTHFANWPREDTFGAVCFAVSFVSFLTYQLIRRPTDG
jgi:Na+(H+)/acetate symporter ActP